MTTYDDVKNLTLTTDANTSKNLKNVTQTSSIGNISVSSGSYTSRSFTINLSQETRFYDIKVKLGFSGISNIWKVLPCRDYSPSPGRQVAINAHQSGTDIVVDVYFANGGVGSYTFVPNNISISVQYFVDEA